MKNEEKTLVVAMAIFDNPIHPKELSLIFNVQGDTERLKGERKSDYPPVPRTNLWGIRTSGGDDFEIEWQKLKDLFQENWHRIPQVMLRGGYIRFTIIPKDEDYFYPIFLSKSIIEDLCYINAKFEVGV